MSEMIRKMVGDFRRYYLYLLVQTIIVISQFTLFSDGTSEIIAEKSIRSGSGVSLLGSIIIFFISPILAGYLATINKNILSNTRKKFGDELSEGISYYWSILGGTLLIGLMVFGVALGCGLLLIIPLLGILGAIAGFIFIIYLGVKYSTIAEAIVYRELGVSEGMDTCKDVAKEHFWELFLLGVPVGILSIISVIIGGVGALIGFSIIAMLYSMFASYYKINLISEVYGDNHHEATGEKEDGYPGM